MHLHEILCCMTKLIKIWEEREYGPRVAMLLISVMIVYLAVVK
jgi:hypothetical protein